jgi:hypothetical protein
MGRRGLRILWLAAAAVLLGLLAPQAQAQFSTGVWWSAGAPGSGYVIETANGRMLFGALGYRASGTAVWYQASGPLFSAALFSGTLIEYAGGQTLTGSARPPTSAIRQGSVSVAASSATAGSVQLTSGSIAIQRYEFVSGGLAGGVSAAAPETGWWWNAAESGRGYFIEAQGGRILVLMMMYETDGSNRWYTATGDLLIGPFGLNPTVSATLEEYGGGQPLGGTYATPTRTAAKGQISIVFSGRTQGVLTLPNGAQIAITRFTSF